MDCRKDKSKLNSIADQKLVTLKPSIKLSAKNMIIALITNKNRPKVRMVTGKVNITNIGFTIKFNKLRTIATIIAVV